MGVSHHIYGLVHVHDMESACRYVMMQPHQNMSDAPKTAKKSSFRGIARFSDTIFTLRKAKRCLDVVLYMTIACADFRE